MPLEDRHAPFRFTLIDQMILVAFLGGILALARVQLAFGAIGFLMFAPAVARAFRVMSLRRSSGTPLGLKAIAAEFARSVCVVLMSYLWTITIFLTVAFLASFVLNILFLLLAEIGSKVGLLTSGIFETPLAIRFGLVIGFGAACIAFRRECIRFWRISDELSGEPKPPSMEEEDWLNQGCPD